MDGRTFERQRPIRADITVPPWLRPERDETLERYAGRLASGIPVGPRPLYFGGVSIGGAIALEMARHVPADGVFLIASATTSRALPHLLRILGRTAPFVPKLVIRPFARRVAPPIVRAIMHKHPEAREILSSAIRDLDLDVWRWGARAIMNWHFDHPLPCPVHQIHGDADPITPIYRVNPDVTVHKGGHMVNVTHPDEVNEFLRRVMGTGTTVGPPDDGKRRDESRRPSEGAA
jgi:pimeloyl-ACP methyl ester carboxylesterase